MTASFTIQRLGPSDLPLFRGLNAVFGTAFGEPDTYGAQPPSDGYLRDLLGKEHVIALVALTDGVVAGGLVAYVLDKFERERREVYLYDLAVAERHRRRGIATALIERLVDVARKRNAYVIFVQADRGDGPAIKLYESLGRKEEVYHFDIATSAGPQARQAYRADTAE